TAVEKRRAVDLACRRGCDACCHVSLALSPVEAASVADALGRLPPPQRGEIAARAERPRLAAAGQSPPCVLLDARGACGIYESRPLVCRTQGLALRYPPGSFPQEAIMANAGGGGDIVWCPLNFKYAAPAGQDVLEAELVDAMLAVVNLRFVRCDRDAALRRIALLDIVRAAVPSPTRKGN
ncbi:MAG: YkgJ family cysteine cluster protein, partial [Polyangiaceae bacterium]|nr:YkgJ family cysteine cluster protein [Polyangiaceae bacterium]